MKKVKFYVKDKLVAKQIYEEAKEIFSKLGIEEVEENYDVAIAIGGDGTFLKMVRSNNFNTDIFYAGISAGTLGFMQEIKFDEIKSLGEAIVHENFGIRKRIFEEITIDDKKEYALNEVAIRNSDFSVLGVKVDIDNNMLENIEGDGVLICTPTGSSAYNLSLGGAIIYENIKCLELTPLAPLNTKAYRSINNSIIVPENLSIDLLIHDIKNNLLITLDGHNVIYNDVDKVNVSIYNKELKCIYINKSNYTDLLNDKLLG